MAKRNYHRSGTKIVKWPGPILAYVSTATYDETTPSGLYAMCTDLEARMEKMDIREIQSSSAWCFLFELKLFTSNPSGDSDTSNEQQFLGDPFSFSIAGPDSKVSQPDWRYQELLRLLKRIDDAELRWLLVARWLYNEGVCEPDEFLPPTILQHLIKRYLARTSKFSTTDCHIWHMINVWTRYFSPLQDAARKIPKTDPDREKLIANLGYDKGAVRLILTTRSLVRAITIWLEERGKGDARSLENAYSRGQSYLRKGDT
jgi:hypothetical protein